MKKTRTLLVVAFVLGVLFLLGGFLILNFGSKKPDLEPLPIVSPTVTADVPDITIKGDLLAEYKNLSATQVSKLMGTGIVKVRPIENQKNNLPIVSKSQEKASSVFALLHLDPSDCIDFAISLSESNVSAYTVAVIRPVEGHEENLVLGLSLRISDLYTSLKDYPEQLYLLDNLQMDQIGDFMVLAICENSEKVFQEIANLMKTTDLTKVKEVPLYTDEERKTIEEEYLLKYKKELEDKLSDVVVTPVETPSVIPTETPVEPLVETPTT